MKDIGQKEYIFGNMFTLANRMQVLGDKEDPNITIKQWLFIAIILKFGDRSLAISEISALIGNSRQNVKKMAVILEKQGFVQLIKDSKDARMIRVCLTKKCMDYFEKREEVERLFIDKLFNGFDEDLLRGFYNGLVKLSYNIAEMEKQNEKEE
ncbi:transcriptional repressor MprA [compost metagenome]|uniref:DNA-binding MarR family transcriptional regulator n=1 Tax=Fontibacillus solani TaxID=1572857 RepID=A0A7W3XRS6_9BACL|nr:MarR family transcriptional regulator [Fontibacillus solani]MBA9085791.1 DNA-binding MarR family transcriptional regulator [Fontibacillus solani]